MSDRVMSERLLRCSMKNLGFFEKYFREALIYYLVLGIMNKSLDDIL